MLTGFWHQLQQTDSPFIHVGLTWTKAKQKKLSATSLEVGARDQFCSNTPAAGAGVMLCTWKHATSGLIQHAGREVNCPAAGCLREMKVVWFGLLFFFFFLIFLVDFIIKNIHDPVQLFLINLLG